MNNMNNMDNNIPKTFLKEKYLCKDNIYRDAFRITVFAHYSSVIMRYMIQTFYLHTKAQSDTFIFIEEYSYRRSGLFDMVFTTVVSVEYN